MNSIIPQTESGVQAESKKIAIYLTDKCNLKCKHCFIEGSPENNDFLNWDQVNTALEYFIQQGYGRVEFTGGESCLSPLLIPAVKRAKELGYTVGINTNGINLNLINLITPQLVDKITFSLDGASSKTHDFLRGKNVFNTCLKTMSAAIARGFNTEAIFTVHKLNITEIPAAIKLLDDLGVNRLSFNFISNQGTAILNQNLLLPPSAWIKARKTIEANSNTKQLSLRYPFLFVTPKEFVEIKKNTNYFCRLLDPVKTEIYPDGKIYHCCLVPNLKGLSAGTVTDKKVMIKTAKERAFVAKYQHLSCPVHEVHKFYAASSKLIPFCLYYKSITHQK